MRWGGHGARWIVMTVWLAAALLGWVAPEASAQSAAEVEAQAEAGDAESTADAPAAVFGLVDSDRIIDEYLAEELREPLAWVTQELQAEFDKESQELSDDEKELLFQEYQARLGAIREALVHEQLPVIQNAIRDVAQSHEFVAVLDVSAVHYGGVDVTDEVLAKLGVVVARRSTTAP